MSSCGLVVASPHWRRGPHRQGDVGLTARATTQECTQIAENGLSAPFRGICVHCCASRGSCERPWGRRSVHRLAKMAPPRRFGAFVYTVGLLRCCGQTRGRNSVHKWEDRASPHRIGAFVYTVGLLRCCGQMRGCNSVHRSPKMASPRRFGAFVYTGATRVAIRIATRAACARWRERLNRHGVPAAPPRWPLPLGREDRLCASGAAARLASSPRRQPTRAPEEPQITASK